MVKIPNIKEIKSKYIPQNASEIKNIEDIENDSFLISFHKYNQNCCGIDNLGKNGGKIALKKIKTIGLLKNTNEFRDNGINLEPVYDTGEYTKYFNGISDDTEMKEFSIQGEERVFCFIDMPDKIFNIVAITKKHTETRKNKKSKRK